MPADFDLQILRSDDGYSVNVLNSPEGEAQGWFKLPITPKEIDELFHVLGRVRQLTRGGASPETSQAQDFGARLFEAVFAGQIRNVFERSLGRQAASGEDLRIRLRLTDVPDLVDLPWELLFDKAHESYLALDRTTTLIRHLPVQSRIEPMRVEPPLRILVAISNPSSADYPKLNAQREWENLDKSLHELEERGQVALTRLDEVTPDTLREALVRKPPCHVLHFIGHGAYQGGSPFIVLNDEHGNALPTGVLRLTDLVRAQPALRLVLLNACEGGRTSRTDPFAGLAQSLVKVAIPAVVAMQFAVTDDAAVVFAGAFYGGLAGGQPVDLALAEARRAVNTATPEGAIEWATPVLYMRGDGTLFDLGTTDRKKPPPTPEEAWGARALRATKLAFADLGLRHLGVLLVVAAIALLMLRLPAVLDVLSTLGGPTPAPTLTPVPTLPIASFQDGTVPFNLWVEGPDAGTSGVDATALKQFKRALFDLVPRAVLQILGDKPQLHIEADLEQNSALQDCAAQAPTARRTCLSRQGVVLLSLHARVAPTIDDEGGGFHIVAVELTKLRNGRLDGFDSRPHSPPHQNIEYLAKWAAEEITLFVAETTSGRRFSKNETADLRARVQEVTQRDLENKANERLNKLLNPSQPAPEPRHSYLQHLVASAFAAETAQDAAVRDTLQRLAAAFEERDKDKVAAFFWPALTKPQKDALGEYFADIKDSKESGTKALSVEFLNPQLSFDNNTTARASFLRVDSFNDRETNRPVRLVVQLVAVLTKSDGGWKVQSLQRPQ